MKTYRDITDKEVRVYSEKHGLNIDTPENYKETQQAVFKEKKQETKIEFTRVKNDTNGNPRYVCHYLNFIRPDDTGLTSAYDLAIYRAKKIGGRKFHNKQYGGGIVFQSYSLYQTEQDIKNLMKNLK